MHRKKRTCTSQTRTAYSSADHDGILFPPTTHSLRCDSPLPRHETESMRCDSKPPRGECAGAPNYEFVRRPTQGVSRGAAHHHAGPPRSHLEDTPGWTTHQFGAGHANNPVRMDFSSRSTSVEAVSQQASLRIGACRA